ncbi:MAG: IS110 family transposase [Mycobacterium sp.]|nr:IS110 family transposase [Mycobacterium sp.]
MNRLIERCAMLDIHKSQITACVRVPDDAGGRRQEVCEFSATTAGLLVLADWLRSFAVTVVGMESTGVYWRAVWFLLEDEFECRLYNARHLRHVPGRKSDVQDAEWGCQLIEHGLVRESFVPPRRLRELRDVVRYRKAKIQERGREVQRVEKTLQDAGIKLSSVASEVLGKSARLMLDALIGGTHDPEVLAQLAKGTLRKKIPALRDALQGRFTGHHALLIGQMLAQIDFLDETIATLSERIEELTAPFSRELELLDTIPGVDRRAAEMLLAEIGPDMSRFPTEHHLASWGGMVPGQRESGGKKHSAATRKGSKWLRGTLTECSKGVVRTKGTYLSARYHRIKSRHGHAKATVATGHKILTAAYHVLNQNVPYHELGEEFFYRRDTEATNRYRHRLVKQLERLGHQVTLQPLAQTA